MNKMYKLIVLVIISMLALVQVQMPQAASVEVNVSDYGAIPDDGLDDSKAVQDAINAAVKQKAQKVVFEKGTYNYSDNPLVGTGSNAYMYVLGASNLTIEGAVDNEGAPATLWLRKNTQDNCADLRQLLFVGNSSNITIRNIAVDNDPYYYSAADIVSVSGNRVTMDILEGHPFWDGMKMNLPGVYDKETKSFIQQRIIWTDDHGSNSPTLISTDGGGERQRVYVDNGQIARAIERALNSYEMKNVTVFWFQGNFSQSCQMLMNYMVSGITYENISILNSTGFALTADYCADVTYRKVRLAPTGNRVAVAPRDGFKMSNISGNVLMDSIVIDGICDDGQNCHGSWVTVNKQINDYTLQCNGLIYGSFDIPVGSNIRLLSADTNQYIWTGTVKKAGRYGTSPFSIETNEPLPKGIIGGVGKNTDKKTLVEFEAFFPETYTVKNSIIRNSYRGLKLSTNNFEISNNLFEYNVYNILMGAQNDPYWIEGRHPENGVINNNIFRKPLDGISISMEFLAFQNMKDAPVMEGIEIYDNQFFDSSYGIWVQNAKDVYIYDNQFDNVEDSIFIDKYSTENIVLAKRTGEQITDSTDAVSESPASAGKPDPASENPQSANDPNSTSTPVETDPVGTAKSSPSPITSESSSEKDKEETANPTSEPAETSAGAPVNAGTEADIGTGKASSTGRIVLITVVVLAASYIGLLVIFKDKIREKLKR